MTDRYPPDGLIIPAAFVLNVSRARIRVREAWGLCLAFGGFSNEARNLMVILFP
jgi:hypothetical protein